MKSSRRKASASPRDQFAPAAKPKAEWSV